MLSSQCTVGAPVWSAKAPIYRQSALVFLTALYMYLISPLVESEATDGCIYIFQQPVMPIIV